MSSYRQIYYQIVFCTQDHIYAIPDAHCEELYKYIWGVIKNKNCKLYRINGVEDHIHIFCDLHPSVALVDLVRDIKVASSLWMKASGKFPEFRSWQKGYGAFTYSHKEKDSVINYIKRQKEHHRNETYPEEYRRILNEFGIEFEERFLL